MNRRRPSRRAAQIVMRASLAASAVLLVVLLARGWGRDALTTAAGVLFVLCVGTCIWTVVIGERSAREVRRAVDRLAKSRHADQGSPPRDAPTTGGTT